MFNKKKKENELTEGVVKPFGERKLGVFFALILGLIVGNKIIPKLVHIFYWVSIAVLTVLWLSGTPVPFK